MNLANAAGDKFLAPAETMMTLTILLIQMLDMLLSKKVM